MGVPVANDKHRRNGTAQGLERPDREIDLGRDHHDGQARCDDADVRCLQEDVEDVGAREEILGREAEVDQEIDARASRIPRSRSERPLARAATARTHCSMDASRRASVIRNLLRRQKLEDSPIRGQRQRRDGARSDPAARTSFLLGTIPTRVAKLLQDRQIRRGLHLPQPGSPSRSPSSHRGWGPGVSSGASCPQLGKGDGGSGRVHAHRLREEDGLVLDVALDDVGEVQAVAPEPGDADLSPDTQASVFAAWTRLLIPPPVDVVEVGVRGEEVRGDVARGVCRMSSVAGCGAPIWMLGFLPSERSACRHFRRSPTGGQVPLDDAELHGLLPLQYATIDFR